MITKITNSNRQFYHSLFQDINNTIESLNIQAIEDYFLNIETIRDYVATNKDKDYFMRLPVDEEIFLINANSRAIVVPTAFKTNGIAVVGDNFAETLWFKIDKYYDIQDLGTDSINIRIYWELPGTKIKGYSVPQYKDVWSEAGQLLFGWAIPQILTENAGNLIFSIRFFSEPDVNGNYYNFNTLSQSVKINSTLFNINDEVDYLEDVTSREVVLGRLQNSTSSAIYITRPSFSLLLPTSIGENELIGDQGTALVATAYSERRDGLVLDYIWYQGGNHITDNVSTVWVQTTDTTVNINKNYYSGQGDGYLIETDDEIANALENNNEITPVYEKGSQLIVTEASAYQVRVVAKVEMESGKFATSQPEYSSVWTFELPKDFSSDEIKFAVSQEGIISEDANVPKPTITIAYPTGAGQQTYAEWDASLYKDGELVENSILPYEVTIPGNYYAQVTKHLNNSSIGPIRTESINIQNAATKVIVALAEGQNDTIPVGSEVKLIFANNNIEGHTYQYQWQFSSNASTWTNWGAVLTEAPTTWQLTQSGYYRLVVKATYLRSEEITTTDLLFSVWSIG